MDVVRHDDPKAFAARTQPFLMADEARHNLLLGITTTLIERPDVYQEFHLWVVEEQRETVAAAICTPPFEPGREPIRHRRCHGRPRRGASA
jgi:uncharacterized protein